MDDIDIQVTPKTRKPNFSEGETITIIDQVKKHKAILCSRQSDAVTNERKKAVWTKISQYMNSRSRNVIRTPDDIRRRWKNMVLAARKELAKIKCMPSGAGAVPALSDLSVQILDINPEWSDFSSYNFNSLDPASMASLIKMDMGGDGMGDDDDDGDGDGDHMSPGSPENNDSSIASRAHLKRDSQIQPRDYTSLRDGSNRAARAKRRKTSDEPVYLHQEIMHLDRENLTLEKEKMQIEKEKLVVEKEHLAIERQKLDMEREKMSSEKEKICMEKEKLGLEIRYWKRKLMQITRIPAENNDANKTHNTVEQT